MSKANKKLTAVEWLRENLHLAKDPFTQALELEKEQIIDFHIETMKVGLIEEGSEKWNDGYLPLIKKTAEQYYQKTYGNK